MKLSELPVRVVLGVNYDGSKQIRSPTISHIFGRPHAREKGFKQKNVPEYRHTDAEVEARKTAQIELRIKRPIDTFSIQWVQKGEKDYALVNCSHLIETIERVLYMPSLYNPLYRRVLDALEYESFAGIARFYVVATGVDPERKRELGTFIKVTVREIGRDFVLPQSFLNDCRAAFLRVIPH